MFRLPPVDPVFYEFLRRMRQPRVRAFEGRREPRHACHHVASLSGAALPTPIGCVIEDVSRTGCRLRLTARTALAPDDETSLYVPCCRMKLAARVVWRKGDEMGVAVATVQPSGARPAAWMLDDLDAAVPGGRTPCRGVSPGSGGRASCAASSRAGWCRNR